MFFSRRRTRSAASFPRLYAAASLKIRPCRLVFPPYRRFSAALCRGLIEDEAKLKPEILIIEPFSAALCRGLIEEPEDRARAQRACRRFPRLYAAASLKTTQYMSVATEDTRFPRLYAAASLKKAHHVADLERWLRFSAALCRGLIEESPGGP